MDGKNQPEETPDAFLKALCENLRAKNGVDVSMVDILGEHIMKSTPHANAVARAKDAILKLAAERAAPLNPVAVGV